MNNTVIIGDKEYELILTTRATKEIAGRYGGLEKLGETLMKSENLEMALDEIIWIVTLLANQSVLIRNLRDREHPAPLLSVEEIELLTTPLDLTDFKDAIMAALVQGTRRNIQSENTGKNVTAG